MKILVEHLTIEAVIGILPSERAKPQPITITAEIDYRYETANDLVDYIAVADLIAARLKKGRFGLLEEAIAMIAPEIANLNRSIRRVTLTLEKPAIGCHFRAAVS